MDKPAPDLAPTPARTALTFAWAAALCALSAPLLAAWPEDVAATPRWLVGLAAHWQWLWLAVGSAGAGAALLARGGKRRWRHRAAALGPLAVLAAVFCFPAPRLQAASPADADGAAFDVVSANLLLETRRFDALEAWLLQAPSPDVVFLQEFTPAAQRVVTGPAMRARFPHQLLAPSHGPFGLAILSRHPFAHTATVDPAGDHTLRLRAVVTWQGRSVRLSAVHPMPPLAPVFAVARDAALRDEAAWVAAEGGLGVVAGDLNDTPWSTGLRGVSGTLWRATGLVPTWPEAGGALSVLPLDHVLATSGWRRLASSRGPVTGSDHRPVRAVLVQAAGKSA